MQLFTVNSTTNETNSDSILYGLLIILLTFTLIYISLYIYVLGSLCSPYSLLIPNSTLTCTKQHESVLLPLSLSRSGSLITWPNTKPWQSEYSSYRSPSDTLDTKFESLSRDAQFPLARLSSRLMPNTPTRQASRAPMNNLKPLRIRVHLGARFWNANVNNTWSFKRKCRTLCQKRYNKFMFWQIYFNIN